MEIDKITYINGYLSAFAILNTHSSDVSFNNYLREVEDIHYPYFENKKVNLEEIKDPEKYISKIIEKWLFMFLEEGVDLKNLFFSESQNRVRESKRILSLIIEATKPKSFYLENMVGAGDIVWDSILIRGEEKNYSLYFSLTD